jgi:acyl-CoA reductase-like NAD-dependent aldehyde dehydrogenase
VAVALTVGGESVQAKETFGVVNPATGEVFDQAPECAPELLDRAMESGRLAFAGWGIDESARRAALSAAGEAIGAAVDQLAPVLTTEQGKPLSAARAEVLGAAGTFKYDAGLERPGQAIQDDDTAHVEVVYRPLGVVAAITPWNFPLILGAARVAPALLAGNTVVFKPSPFTPLSSLALGQVLAEVFPPGVLNVLSGGDELGEWMTNHPVPRKIAFTGSVATGKKVAAAAANDLKRVTLELGGNDPAIVLEDADAATIAGKLFWAAFTNTGQVCCAVKRVYVYERIYDDVVEAVEARARKVRVRDGIQEDTQLGPINNLSQFRRVSSLVKEAVDQGARVVTGGSAMDRPGYFFEPTILADLSDGVRIVDEEQFGPALPIIKYRQLDAAAHRANDTHFGLSASVWGSDAARARGVAGELECATGWVNAHGVQHPDYPVTGSKWSGLGVEAGPWGQPSFSELQVLYSAKG